MVNEDLSYSAGGESDEATRNDSPDNVDKVLAVLSGKDDPDTIKELDDPNSAASQALRAIQQMATSAEQIDWSQIPDTKDESADHA